MIRSILWRCLIACVLILLAAATITSSSGCAASNAYGDAVRQSRAKEVQPTNAALVPPPLPTAASNQRVNLSGHPTTDFMPLPNEELWIIGKSAAAQIPAARDEQIPGSGALVAQDPASNRLVPIPLKHTDVKASIAGFISTVDVTQQFENPFNGKIEAAYVFPVPQDAAINEFVMTIGDRRIRGIIRERQEAQELYLEARSQGYVATLLTQERPNVFTQKVANIEPGKRIDVSIRYFNTLAYNDGWYEFVFPMVVGPRFNPPASNGQGIGAVGIGQRGASGQATEVSYLDPTQRSGHDISLSVRIDAGVKVEDVQCATHKVRSSAGADRAIGIELDPADSIPNKDFVLRYRLAGREIKPNVIVYRDPKTKAGYFTLMLVPPDDVKEVPRSPLEMIFTLDVSGSMAGQPLAQAKAAVRYALTHLRAEDTFGVVLFASSAKSFFDRPVPATPDNVRAALRFIDQTDAGGGTMMLEGIRASLVAPADESRPRYVAFLTDGYIGNEAEILSALHQSLGAAHVFSFGVGSSTNRYLLDHLACLGNGAAAYLGPNDPAEPIMADYFSRISHPALRNISIEWAGMQVSDICPQRVNDLYVGRPLVLTGRFTGNGKQTIRISGTVGGQRRQFEIPINLDDRSTTSPALPVLWARSKIADLSAQATYTSMPQLSDQVKQLSLEYGLMSSFTSFIAVDSLSKTAGEYGTTVTVPVPVPDGVRYDTAVHQ